MVRKSITYLMLGSILLCLSAERARAASPAEVQAGMAAAPVAASMVDDLVAIGLMAGRVLYVPLGVGQLALSPLPGITAAGGLVNIARGIAAPAQAAVGLLKLPFALVRAGPAADDRLPAAPRPVCA